MIGRLYENLARAHGRLGKKIGDSAEKRVAQAFLCGIPWLLSPIRKTTRDEDARGIDCFVRTDAGDIPLQIKSSEEHAREFSRTHPEIPVVVIDLSDSDRTIRAKVTDAVAPFRKRLLSPDKQKDS